jgi:tetratricopeptide (TPR) repeat protein
MTKSKVQAKKKPAKKDSAPAYPGLAFAGWIVLLGTLTWLIYSATLGFDLTNWDEKHYIHEQAMTRGLSGENMEAMFTKKVLGSYNPLVILSFAVDFEIAGGKASWYHGVNVFFHILNTILLFIVVRKLSFRTLIAGFIALLFALHPMHVESVAWVASRKDVLMGFFLFSSWWAYLHFREVNKRIWYFSSLLLFLFALLSKAQAVSFPLILILSDYLRQKSFKKDQIYNKIPFLVLAVCTGLYAISGSTFAADKYASPLNFVEKIAYSFMALWNYCFKAVLPVHQSAIYAFPQPGSQGYWIQLVLGIVVAAGMLWFIIRSLRRQPLISFALLFFLINTFLTLHVVAVNSSLIYERFTYISYVGLFFLIAFPLNDPKFRNTLTWVLAAYCLIFAWMTHERIQVWKNSVTLWTDVIEKNPISNEAYNNRGDYYNSAGFIDKAFEDFTNSVRVNPKQPNAYNNLAVIWFKRNNLDKALEENQKALDLDPDYAQAASNRGILYFNRAEYDSAIHYYNRAIKLMPNYPFAICNLGSVYLKKEMYDEAIRHYKQALSLRPDYADASKYMGLAYLEKEDFAKAEEAMYKAQEMNPSGDALKVLSGEYILKASRAFKSGDARKAIFLCEKSLNIMPGNAEGWYNMGGYYLTLNDVPKAREYWKKALQINPDYKEAREWLSKIGE